MNEARPMKKATQDAALKVAGNPLPVRPAGLGSVSEAQQEARRRAGMFWFIHKRDQQGDWS
jgi:hypothetical protein